MDAPPKCLALYTETSVALGGAAVPLQWAAVNRDKVQRTSGYWVLGHKTVQRTDAVTIQGIGPVVCPVGHRSHGPWRKFSWVLLERKAQLFPS